jgi:hypothetical protein
LTDLLFLLFAVLATHLAFHLLNWQFHDHFHNWIKMQNQLPKLILNRHEVQSYGSQCLYFRRKLESL